MGLGITRTDILLFLGDEAILQTQTDPQLSGPLRTCLRSFYRKTHQPVRPPLLLWSLVSSPTLVLVRRVHRGDMTGTLSFNQITIHNGWPCKYLMRESHGANESGTHTERRRHHNSGGVRHCHARKRSNRKCIYPIFMRRLNGSPV